MPIKLLMRWDVRPEKESEYFEYLVHEFIPSLNKLGIAEIQVWYTAYGDCEQKLAEGITDTPEKMQAILNSNKWQSLLDKLENFVVDFDFKMIPATKGFQI